MKKYLLKNDVLYVSYLFLRSRGIPEKTIGSWGKNKTRDVIYDEGKAYINYDDIPNLSKEKLPKKITLIAECRVSETNEQVEAYVDKTTFLLTKGCVKYRNEYKEKYKISNENALKAGQLKAFWQWVIDAGIKDTRNLFEAFNKVMPGKYKSYNVFANVKSTAAKEGVEKAAFDKRWLEASKNVKRIAYDIRLVAGAIISIGKKYSDAHVHRQLITYCSKFNIEPPSERWVNLHRQEILKNPVIYQSRNGAKATKTVLPYQSLIHAANPLDQLQFDGWNFPYYIINSKGETFHRPVIVVVRDAYSKKIVGFSVGETENTIVIMEALKSAINNTGMLPFEFLTDKHSFNSTKEAEYFVSQVTAIGSKFEVDINPQRKSIVERYFKHFDALCKDYYGYIGEGRRTRNINGIPKQEILNDVQKVQNHLTLDQVKLRAVEIVDSFNNAVLPNVGKSPNQLFDEKEKVNAYALSFEDRVKVLSPVIKLKINRGQINIERAGTKYEFALTDSEILKCNGDFVNVRYEALDEEVLVFNEKTDDYITTLKPKRKAHGAIANQTPEDTKIFLQAKGRHSGLIKKSKDQIEEMRNKGLAANPEVFEYLDPMLTPKNELKEIEQKAHLKLHAEDIGVNVDSVYVPDVESDFNDTPFKQVEKKSKGPFKVDKDHVFRKIDLSEFDDNDDE